MLESELTNVKKIYKDQQEDLRKKQLHLQELEKAKSDSQNNVLIWNEVNTGTAPVDPPGWQEVPTNAA